VALLLACVLGFLQLVAVLFAAQSLAAGEL
jgi:hypothetical protein